MCSPLQVQVRVLLPALNASMNWEPAGCRACVGGRHRSCPPSSCQRLWTPNGRQGKLKSHHGFPPCPHPLSGRKQLVLILLPNQTRQKQPLLTGSQSYPTPSSHIWAKLQDHASVHRSSGAEPSLLKQVSVTVPPGMMKPLGLQTACFPGRTQGEPSAAGSTSTLC